MIDETCSMIRGIRKIISAVVPSCFKTPLTLKMKQLHKPKGKIQEDVNFCTLSCSLRSWGSDIALLGMKALRKAWSANGWLGHVISTHPIGVKVSNPFTVDQGKPCFLTFSCRLRAVISTPNAWQTQRTR